MFYFLDFYTFPWYLQFSHIVCNIFEIMEDKVDEDWKDGERGGETGVQESFGGLSASVDDWIVIFEVLVCLGFESAKSQQTVQRSRVTKLRRFKVLYTVEWVVSILHGNVKYIIGMNNILDSKSSSLEQVRGLERKPYGRSEKLNFYYEERTSIAKNQTQNGMSDIEIHIPVSRLTGVCLKSFQYLL